MSHLITTEELLIENIMIYNHLNRKALLIFLTALLSFSLSAEVSPDAGKKLFKNNCARCHAKNMKSDATGPALGGVQERWDNEADLYAWIRNSQGLIATGNARANALFKEWNGSVMNSFEALSDDDIGSILSYVQGTYLGTYPAPVAGAPLPGASDVAETSNAWMYWLLLGLLGIIAFVLFRITGGMGQIAAEKTGEAYVPKTLLETLTSKGVVSLLLFALIVFAGYTTVNNAVGLGRQQGYAPDQPIKFSHATHAGINKIDCKYCHDGARRSKHAVIPAANTCMNCHAAINYGSEYGTGEITKIYASVGYDPSEKKYIDGDKSEEELEAIYTKWIESEYLREKGIEELDKEGKDLVSTQWEEIVSSLTNEQKKTVQGPIEWTRIHNLPDHVYFNHAQHVTVGQIQCQDCHGAVEEMEVAQQMSPLSMGWCINCHRETEVQFSTNEYYKSYVKYHDDIASGKKDKVTVSDIGGLECQKCHY